MQRKHKRLIVGFITFCVLFPCLIGATLAGALGDHTRIAVGVEHFQAPLSDEEVRQILQMLSSGDGGSAVHVTGRSDTFSSQFVQGGIPTTSFEVGTMQGGRHGWLQQTVASTNRGLFASMDSIFENALGAFTGSKIQFMDAFSAAYVTEAVIANVGKAIKYNSSSGADRTGMSGEDVNLDYYITEIGKILVAGTDITPALVEGLIARLTTCYSCGFSLMAEDRNIEFCGGETCLVVDRTREMLPAVYAALSQTPTSGSDPLDMEKFMKDVNNMIDDKDRTWQEQLGKANQSGGSSAGQGGGLDFLQMLQQMGSGSGSSMSDSSAYTDEAAAMRQANTNIEAKGNETLNSMETLVNEPNQCITTRTGYMCTLLQCPVHSGVTGGPNTAAQRASQTETNRYGTTYGKYYLGVNFPAICCSEPVKATGIASPDMMFNAYWCLPINDQELIREHMVMRRNGGEATKEWWFGLANASSDPAFYDAGDHDWCKDGKCSRLAGDEENKNKHCMLWHLLECRCTCVDWGGSEPTHRRLGISGSENWTSKVNGQLVRPGGGARQCGQADAEKHLTAAIACHELSNGTAQTCCRSVPIVKEIPEPIGVTFEQSEVSVTEVTGGTVIEARTIGGENIKSETGVYRRVGRQNVRQTSFVQRPAGRTWGRGLRRLGGETATNGPRLTNDGGILGVIELRAFGSPAGFTLSNDMFISGRHGMHNPLETEIMLYDIGWVPGMSIKLAADGTGRGDNSYAQRLSQFLTYTNFEIDSQGNYVLDLYGRRKPIPTTVIAPTSVIRDKGSGYYPVGGKWLAFTAGQPGVPVDPHII